MTTCVFGLLLGVIVYSPDITGSENFLMIIGISAIVDDYFLRRSLSVLRKLYLLALPLIH
eukprot:CAMPEP_0204832884 /NCGR_PEP_ID=MMETSP1346-20131115/15025_1 /ASSEMBLY_ACC=CAM_ASM_000771 /TAXON_ID=215587 /ORGANISM="Aplanochytrium stocchinoi, Strain GSBS06" /LENGTH=59 /DNA_ID=CAMNT_0051964987 /DNA_START=572 /DNA_END=751 /DNA_ORIENTATION=+